MPAWFAQQYNEKGMMEATCPQAVCAGLAIPGGLRAPRLQERNGPSDR